MRTNYVLDTSVLIYDPSVFRQFPHSDILIPIAVLNELDRLKKLPNEAGKHARVAIKLIDEISNIGDISTGILLDNDTMLKVDATYIDLSQPAYAGLGDPDYGDTQILACAQANWHAHPEHDVILVSNDINLRIKAKARGIDAQAHDGKGYALSDLYSGMRVSTNEDAGIELQKTGYIDPAAYGLQMEPHECILFNTAEGAGIAMGRKVSADKIKLVKKVYPWNVSARNAEQSFAIDLMMDRSVDLVTMIGKSGTGKTLLSIACALELVLAKREYEKLIIYRPICSVGGQDLGYLPGLLAEKLEPWFQSVMDSFEALFTGKNGGWKSDLEMYQKKGRIEMEAITFIRGRSIKDAIIYVDECQNLSKEDIKTILTRAGEGSKIIMSGDINQIDVRDLDAVNNGLIYAAEKFKSSELAGHVILTKGERSRLATLSSEIL